jgi:hypothetical protein
MKFSGKKPQPSVLRNNGFIMHFFKSLVAYIYAREQLFINMVGYLWWYMKMTTEILALSAAVVRRCARLPSCSRHLFC